MKATGGEKFNNPPVKTYRIWAAWMDEWTRTKRATRGAILMLQCEIEYKRM